jgi:segregation and condensation protein A
MTDNGTDDIRQEKAVMQEGQNGVDAVDTGGPELVADPEHAERAEGENPLAQYSIELDTFQGPLDLLLHLIRKNEVDIYDIPMAEISRQYVEYLDVMHDLNLEVASEFLVMASTLIYIKSRMLLPAHEEEEELEEEDPREELVRRLLEYQKYKQAAEELSGRPRLDRDVFVRPESKPPDSDDDVFVEASLFQLMDAFQSVLAEAETRKPHEVEREVFTLEDGINHISAMMSGKPSLRFRDLFDGLGTKRRVVTVFLSVLELIKRGNLMAVQSDFGQPLRLVLKSSKIGREGMTDYGSE